MPTANSLNTVVRNTSGASHFFAWLGLHGTTLPANGTYSVVGGLTATLARNSRLLAGLQNDLINNRIEILSTPAEIYVDQASGAVKQLLNTNGVTAVADPSWGPYNNFLTGAFGSIATPTSSAVATATLVFNSAINALPLSALTLTKNGSPLVLTGAPTTSDNITWTIPSLTALTGTSGVYILSVPASTTITDSYGNSLASPLSVTWTHS